LAAKSQNISKVEAALSPWKNWIDKLYRAVFALVAALVLAAAPVILFAQDQFSTSEDGSTMTVYDAPDMSVVAFGKTVIVRNRAKDIVAIGGDITIEGSVSGDVATIGGSITQGKDAYIGGDVIAFGGAYKADSQSPLREAGKETVMFGVFEDEIRGMAKNPSEIFAPSFSWAFLAQRLLSVLFWFVVSFGLTTLAPGSISRAIARFQLSTLKVAAIGTATFVLMLIGVFGSVRALPDYLSVSLGLMAFVLLMLAYVFGRVALQLSVGKFLQKNLLPNGNRSETLAILFGVVFWTLLLSVPYVWTLAVMSLFISGLGLVLTARRINGWRHS
jgi:hypothetical protein